MDTLLQSAGATLITAAMQLSGFAVAFALQTEVFYDVVGGLNFVAVAAFSAHRAPNWTADVRKLAATICFVCSRCWLLLFLAWRAHERKGDARFDGVKDKFGTFLTFWCVQGVWVLLISNPLLLINSSPTSPPLSPFDVLCLAGFIAGLLCEIIADIQKASWVKAGRQGGFCQSGLWHFSRHPNYFGEMLQWWCIWLLAFSSSSGLADLQWWASCSSPLFTMFILLCLPKTGVYQANGKNLKRYYDRWPESYSKYRASTSILVPMVGYKYVPMLLKRTLFLDFPWYEYKPKSAGKPQTSTRDVAAHGTTKKAK
ncbi:hypothetical protein AB1Y20_023210 [Prymnesium parvum]|uniref:Steroid 5-alpha reductase C-terminal domain-containing protein n=1 Tax=Prymnesium parvum TaxID=97485 RepID=A0AB34JFP7_PRYPA